MQRETDERGGPVAEDRDESFREYVLARRNTLLREAYLLVGDVHLAEDLVQTTLAKAYVAWRRVTASKSPDAYVRRILINTNISRARRRGASELPTTSLPDSPALSQDRAERIDLLRALETLPRRQRAAVVLRYWADLPEAEVADIMGCSVGTVRSQAFRGLAKLRGEPSLRRSVPREA
jgi:RNA polymerase sigma-70 factor (sigma-E family)